MSFNLARLFSYTRALERQIIDAHAQFAIERVTEGGRHRDEIARLIAAKDAEIDRLSEDRDAERKERQFLQDRLLQKIGAPPVYEPSAGEVAAREAIKQSHNPPIGGLRAHAQVASAERRAVQLAVVKQDIADYVETTRGKANDQPGS